MDAVSKLTTLVADTATMAEDQKIRVLYVACRRGCSEDILASTELQARIEAALNHFAGSRLEWATATSQKEALRLIRLNPPRLAVIELDHSARRFSFCRKLRERLPSLKIVVIGQQPEPPASPMGQRNSQRNGQRGGSGDGSRDGSWDGVADGVHALDADGFLPLPFDGAAAQAIVAKLLDGYHSSVIEIGPIHLNADLRLVITPKGQYHMTPKTTALLQYLMAHHGQVLSRSEIMQNVWETDYLEDTRTLDVHIRWLRERIEEEPSVPHYLTTVRGRGYRLQLRK